MTSLNELALVARSVGSELLRAKATRAVEGAWLNGQFKASIDDLAHRAMVGQLEALEPQLPVVSEEDVSSQSASRPHRYFLIDPIDGTASLCQGFPGWVTQVAVMEGERPLLSAIYAPELDELFLAELGRGATCNGRSLGIRPRAGRRVLIDNYPEPRGIAADAMRELAMTGYIESGSISLKICRIADGTADLFLKDVTIRDWDVAPAHLVIAEAGGMLTTGAGRPWEYTGRYEKSGIIAASVPALAFAAAHVLTIKS